jgi:hypothetical protein
MSRVNHLKAHASRLLASAERFRHRGHNACADQITAQAEAYLEAAASLEAGGSALAPQVRVVPTHGVAIAQALSSRTPAHGANGAARF